MRNINVFKTAIKINFKIYNWESVLIAMKIVKVVLIVRRTIAQAV